LLIAGAQLVAAGLTPTSARAHDQPAALSVPPRLPSTSISPTPWTTLTQQQQQALAPLQSEWSRIDSVQQRKWLELAVRFPNIGAAERARIQERMAQWASLTPAKRSQVRLQFLEAQRVPAEQRQARWQEYQALSAEEKQTLAKQARQLKPTGADTPAAASTPGIAKAQDNGKSASGKLNEVKALAPALPKAATSTSLQAKPGATTRPLTAPVAPPAHHQTGLPKIVATDNFVDPATMLPKRGPQGAAVRSAPTDNAPRSLD
jgi:hypothetical protein